MLTATVLLTVITTSQGAYNEVPSNDVVNILFTNFLNTKYNLFLTVPLYWYLWGIQFFIYMVMQLII